jgi:O-6-methylguanine DNA methyltransferase
LEYIKSNKFEISNHKDAKEHSILNQLENAINDYLTGTKIDLFEEMKSLDVSLDISNLFNTDFSQKVINSLIKIRPGESTTYSDLAKKVNSKAYRAVGSVLRKNPLPLIIPCHRVIKKNGKIGGFMGQMDEDWQINLKRSLLRIEGFLI